MQNKTGSVLLRFGAILTLLSLVLFPTALKWWIPLSYFVGAALFALCQFLLRPKESTQTVRRLCLIQTIGGLALVLTTIPLAMACWNVGRFSHNEWLVALAIAAWLEIYTAFRLSSELKKK